MESGSNSTARANCIRYTECTSGDQIEGTKEQLQSLGLGVGLAFPGEVGGPRIVLKVRDPRGYPVMISKRGRNDDRYIACLTFPDWPARPDPYRWMAIGIGIGLKKREYTWFDEFIGSAEALVSAGLVRSEQLPGRPGMRKVRVTILPDGSMPSGAPTANNPEAKLTGARWIERASASSYRVRIVVAEDEKGRRERAERVAYDAWLQLVRALPRPARLQPMEKSKWDSLEAARASAARDIGFQGMLARIVASANRPAA